jgi:hypothetical protein
MKVHTTNYFNTFITLADDCTAQVGEMPPIKADNPTVAAMQYEMLATKPYQYTSDEVIFLAYAQKLGLTKGELAEAKASFFSKGQACMRASALTKRYGWGIHYNADGKMAIYSCDSKEYKKFLADKTLKVIKAMRSSK